MSTLEAGPYLDDLNERLAGVHTLPQHRSDAEIATMAAAMGETKQVAELLQRDERDLRIRAAKALAMLDGRPALDAILARLPEEADALVRATIYVGLALSRPDDERAAILATPFRDLEARDVAGFAARTTEAVLLREKLPESRKARLLEDSSAVLEINPALQETTWNTSGVDALGAALNAVGMTPEDAPSIARRFTEVRTPEQAGLVLTALWLAIDDGPTRPEFIAVLDAVLEHDHLWADPIAPMVRRALETFNLPSEREALQKGVENFRS